MVRKLPIAPALLAAELLLADGVGARLHAICNVDERGRPRGVNLG